MPTPHQQRLQLTPRPMDIPDLTPLQWALAVVLLLLALAGIWHIGARLAGYKVLPMYQPSACGGPPHQLAYITANEAIWLIERARKLNPQTQAGKPQLGTQGVPCYPVHDRGPYSSPPPSPKRFKRTDEAPSIEPNGETARVRDGYNFNEYVNFLDTDLLRDPSPEADDENAILSADRYEYTDPDDFGDTKTSVLQ